MSISWQEDRKKNKQASASRAGNKFWEEEKDNFGTRMMTKMGWEQGKGLGKSESGITSHLRARKKNDSLGIGADKRIDDSWTAMAGMYNDLLKKLNTAQVAGDQAADVNAAADETPAPKTAAPTVKAYIARTQLYSRFKRSKDVSSYSKEAMSEILGRKSPVTIEPPVEAPAAPASPEASTESLLTVTSSLSIKDYFAKKLAANKASSRFQVAGGSGFTLDQQAKNYDHMLERSQTNRGGLGFGAPVSPAPAPGPRRSPRLKALEVTPATPPMEALDLSTPAEEDEAEAKKRRKAEKRARKEALLRAETVEAEPEPAEEVPAPPPKKRKAAELSLEEETVDPAEAKRLRKEARAAARAAQAALQEETAAAAALEEKAAAKAARRRARAAAAATE